MIIASTAKAARETGHKATVQGRQTYPKREALHPKHFTRYAIHNVRRMPVRKEDPELFIFPELFISRRILSVQSLLPRQFLHTG